MVLATERTAVFDLLVECLNMDEKRELKEHEDHEVDGKEVRGKKKSVVTTKVLGKLAFLETTAKESILRSVVDKEIYGKDIPRAADLAKVYRVFTRL
jgi:hypothetical protein